jgi:hypothetical protein
MHRCHKVCQDYCSGAREVELNSKPQRNRGATISQPEHEFKSKLYGAYSIGGTVTMGIMDSPRMAENAS